MDYNAGGDFHAGNPAVITADAVTTHPDTWWSNVTVLAPVEPADVTADVTVALQLQVEVARNIAEYKAGLVDAERVNLDYDYIDVVVSILPQNLQPLLRAIGSKITLSPLRKRVRGVYTDESMWLQLTAFPWVLKLDLNEVKDCDDPKAALLVELQRRGHIAFAHEHAHVSSTSTSTSHII
jgi:hypothetical protein